MVDAVDPVAALVAGPADLGQIVAHGLVGDEVRIQRVHVDTGRFEPVSRLDPTAGTHVLVGQQPVVVLCFPVDDVHAGVPNRGQQQRLVEPVGQVPQALSLAALTQPGGLQVGADGLQIVGLDEPRDLRAGLGAVRTH